MQTRERNDADEVLAEAIALGATDADDDEAVERLMAVAGGLPRLEQARTRCLSAIERKDPNLRGLLRALDLLDESVERVVKTRARAR